MATQLKFGGEYRMMLQTPVPLVTLRSLPLSELTALVVQSQRATQKRDRRS